jgi:CheY-like chemotaxis protein
MTVLVVEDSRFASEAVRLLCLKSGARIRRADSLRSARRHLAAYQPTVIIVDLGLPDGHGLDLIRDLVVAPHRIPVILATSADDRGFVEASDAGADGALLKPIKSLSAFQSAVLEAMPVDLRPDGLRLISTEEISPDPIALKDDLAHIAEVIGDADDGQTVDYVAQFLTGVARTANDGALEDAAVSLATRRQQGESVRSDLARVAGLLQERLQDRRAI